MTADQQTLLNATPESTEEVKEVAKVQVETTVKEVMPRTVDDVHSHEFQMMDQADEDMIIEEIKGSMLGEMSDKWVYQFNNQGNTVTGLSWVGTKELRYWLAKKGLTKITEVPEFSKVEIVTIDGVTFAQAKSVMKDLNTGITSTATVLQAFTKKRKDGSTYKLDAEFVPRIAESKAQRNAMQKLIPASQLADFISNALNQGKVQRLAPSKEGMTLSADEFKVAQPYLSHIEGLQTLEECKAYWVTISKLTGKLSGRVMHNLKSALTTKAEGIKKKAAEAKVKQMVKEGEQDAK